MDKEIYRAGAIKVKLPQQQARVGLVPKTGVNFPPVLFFLGLLDSQGANGCYLVFPANIRVSRPSGKLSNKFETFWQRFRIEWK